MLDIVKYVESDGGRKASGRKGHAGDCVCRAISHYFGGSFIEYENTYKRLAKETGQQRASKRTKKQPASARNGINVKRKWFVDYMNEMGLTFKPLTHAGSSKRTYLDDMPKKGKFILSMGGHYSFLQDGVLYDTWGSRARRGGVVNGYWSDGNVSF